MKFSLSREQHNASQWKGLISRKRCRSADFSTSWNYLPKLICTLGRAPNNFGPFRDEALCKWRTTTRDPGLRFRPWGRLPQPRFRINNGRGPVNWFVGCSTLTGFVSRFVQQTDVIELDDPHPFVCSANLPLCWVPSPSPPPKSPTPLFVECALYIRMYMLKIILEFASWLGISVHSCRNAVRRLQMSSNFHINGFPAKTHSIHDTP